MSREIAQIVAAFAESCIVGKSLALATVVAVEGSSYRRPGARMLIAGDGKTWGSISGGCLERDVARRGREVIDSGKAAVVAYDTSGEDDDESVTAVDLAAAEIQRAAEPGAALGCGGRIEILIEPLSAAKPGPMTALSAAALERRWATMATVVRVNGVGVELARRRVWVDGREVSVARQEPSGEIADAKLRAAMVADLAEFAPHRVESAQIIRHELSAGGSADVLVERMRPAQAVVLFGDGHDVGPMVEMGRILGWHITLVGRSAEAGLRQRFAGADRFVHAPAENPTGGVMPDADGAAVIMGHDLRRDTAVLRALAQRPPMYVGILGPRHRTELLKQSAGISELPDRFFSPVGLDIGARTPEQIAMAILAEIQAVRTGRPGTFLRQRQSPIHGEVGGT